MSSLIHHKPLGSESKSKDFDYKKVNRSHSYDKRKGKRWIIKKKIPSLPTDVMYSILIYITDIKTLKNMREVSIYCNNIFETNIFWKDKFAVTLPFFNFQDPTFCVTYNEWTKGEPDQRSESEFSSPKNMRFEFELYCNVISSQNLAIRFVDFLLYSKCLSSVFTFVSSYDITPRYPIHELISNNHNCDSRIYGISFTQTKVAKRVRKIPARKSWDFIFSISYNCSFSKDKPNCVIVCDVDRCDFILRLTRLFYYFPYDNFSIKLNYSKYSKVIEAMGPAGVKNFLHL